MGGDSQMRGYYLGALRDHVLVDGQMEYRMPVWGIFGATTWIATGRVAHAYNDLQFQDWWLSYGVGFRVRVDTKSNVNMRVDFGFGPGGITGTYINFAEAF
jgi:outer membrane translocation and assembly module TamA